VTAPGYAGGNFINYRRTISGLIIGVTLKGNYSEVYGTAHNSAAANAWLQNPANSTITLDDATTTATFGLSATVSEAYAKSVLIFSPTVGGTSSSNGTNANAVQTATALTAASLSASDGSTINLTNPSAFTYTITPAVLGIAVSGIYNGTTTFTSTNSTITTTGLASWDRITSVTVSSANASGATTFVTAFAGNTPATETNTFSASNYVMGTSYNGTLSSGLPVNGSQATATNRVNISPAPIGVTINAVYSGSTVVTPSAFTVTGLVNSQTITAISAATINNANVSANASNYMTAITVSGGTASMNNYSITPAYSSVAGNTRNTVTLSPKAVTVTDVTIAAKTYDGTTSAVVSGGRLVGVTEGDTANVSLTQSASFSSAGAANNVALLMNGSISGSASSNYTLTVPTGITANIARKAITVGGTSVAANKVYDGTTATTISGGTLSGVITADLPNVSLSQSGNFVQTGVGTGIGVVVTTSITGSAASNYVVTQPANLSANITTKVLTVSGTAVTDKVYNGSNLATITGGALVGVVGTEAVSLTQAGTFASANAGNAIPVTITNSIGGAASANYTLTQPTGITGRITPAPLGISVAAIYSGSTTIAPSAFSVTGLVNGETITGISSAVINNMNVAGNSTNFVRSIAISTGSANANNYSFGSVASTSPGTSLNSVTLTAKTLTVTGTLADSKVYDGSTAVRVWGGTLVGVIGVDVVTLRQAGALNSPNVGNAIPVVMSNTISGFSAPNYSLVQPSGVTGAITPRAITISDGTVAHKVYDGTTNAVITGGALVGVLSGDVNNVLLTQAGRFSSPNVSNGIIIITSASISGSAAGNYSLVQPAGITANITPAMLGISVVGVANGTNTITPISYTINGLIGGQTITGLSSVSVKSSSISSNGSNFVTGIVISGGTALATNYAFAPSYSAGSSATQNIATLVAQNQKILTVTGAVAAPKVYDGSTSITVTGATLVGVTGGDTINLIQSGVLINPNVSATAAVALNFSITGTNAANYLLVQPSGITTIVTPAPIGIVVTGEYNGTTNITPTSFTITGLVSGETISGLSSATFNAANVSNNGSNYVTSIVSSGGTASLSNYSLSSSYVSTAGNTRNIATITAKALTVDAGTAVADKVYDGNRIATITGGSLVGVIGSDAVNLTQAGTFAQSAVGNSIAVTASNSLSGAAASNYSIIQPTGLTASITPKELTVSGVSVSNKVYDGTTAVEATAGTLVGLIPADNANVTLTQSANFTSANVGDSIPVIVSTSISGTAAANYTVTQPSGLSANITSKSLTITGTSVANKVYDGSTAATVTAGTLVGLVSSDVAGITFTRAASFSSPNAANAISIVMNNSISGPAAGNYTLTQPTGITANISPKALTVIGTSIGNKVYDGTATAPISGGSLVGVVAGDAVALNEAASFSQSNVGTGLAVTVANTLTNNGAGNYTLTQPTGFTANITPAPITVSIASQTKEYDATNIAILTAGTSSNPGSYTLSGFVSGQGAYITQTNASYNSANVADATTVTASLSSANYVATGSTNLSNYALPTSVSAAGVITPATLTMTANAAAKFVGQSDPAIFSYTLSGLKGADTSSVLNSPDVTRPPGEDAGTSYVLTPVATAANYNINFVTSSFTIIAQGQLLIQVGNTSRAYGTLTSTNLAGSAAVSASYCTIGTDCSAPHIVSLNVAPGSSANTFIATDAKTGTAQGNYTLTVDAPALTTANSSTGGFLNVGNYSFTPSNVVVTNQGYSTNYATSYPVITIDGSTTIAPLALSINTPSPSKMYDATNAIVAKLLTPGNAVAGDELIVRGSGTYTTTANAGTGLSYALSGISLSGADAANYSFAGNVTGTNGEITKAVLTISGATAANKTYDGTTAASFSGGTLNGLVSSDSANVTLTQAGTFSQINVGDNLTVTAANVLGGSAAGNYSLIQPTGLTANITPKALTVTGTTVANKEYDGNNVATVTGGTLVGRLNNDNVTLVQVGNFSTANVGTGLEVTIANTLANNTAGNYTLIQPTGLTADITPKALTILGATVANKTYDGTNVANISGGSLVGVVGTENVTLTEAAIFSQSNVGTGLAVTALNVLGGTAAGNYSLTQQTGLTANIEAKALTVVGTTVANKTYDRTNTATVSGGSLVGVITGDTIGLVQAGTFGQINVGRGLAVTIANTLTNNAAGNYSLTQPTGLTADITPKELTVTGTTVANKTYDGNNVATIANGTLVGVVSGDNVSLNEAATFSQSNVGIALAVTTANTLSNNAAGNYTLVQPTDLTADITPKALTVTGAAVANKVYDGSTAATFTAGTLTGRVGSDDVTLTQVGSFSQAGVGTGLTVTATSVLSGSSAMNYSLTQPTGLSANITAKALTVSGAVVADKVYDGTTVATMSAGTLEGVVSSDTANLIVAPNASFGQANVGNGLTVTAAYSITGSAAGNYTLTQPTGLSANITHKALTVSGTTVTNKTYDGLTSALVTGGSLMGVVSGDNVGLIEAGSFSSANVGTGLAVTIANTLSNNSAGNYTLIQPTGFTADITARPISLTANSATKVYGNADPSYTYATESAGTNRGLVTGDTFTGTLARAAGENVGSYAINQGSLANSNYNISFVSDNLAITARPITITAPVINKVYDGGYTYDFTPADLLALNSQLVRNDSFNAAKAVFSGNDANIGNDKIILIDPASVVINDGNSGSNYLVSSVNSRGNITPANLFVTAANDAKFSVEADASGYAGALYKGFVNGETIANLPVANQTLQITRSDAGNDLPGVYALTPGGHGAQGEAVGNYRVSYINGVYTILGPRDLLIRANAVADYGSTPAYSFTAKFLDSNGSTISYVGNGTTSLTPITLTTNGSSPFTLSAGSQSGSSVTTGLMPTATFSASGNANAGQYNVTSTPNPNKTGFEELVVVGSLVVNPLLITTPSLSATSISKVYDGSAIVSSQVTNLVSGSAQLIAGDNASLSAIGTYDNRHVGSNKEVTVNFAITGVDAANYRLSANQISGNYGAITQLSSVTYIGPAGGNWSDANNWAGGAIPDLSNVANVIIPVGTSVTYNAAVAGPVTSQVAANGALNLASAGGSIALGGISGSGSVALGPNSLTLSNAASGNFSGEISGSGGLTVAAGTQTLSGSNTYTGNTAINSGSKFNRFAGSGSIGQW
jgi:hypothetical protein